MNTDLKEQDLRVIRTKKLICNGLRTLLKKRALEDITVNAICTEAMVHRSTFYKYFTDKYDLLKFCYTNIHDEVINNINKEKNKCDDISLVASERLVAEFLQNKNCIKNLMATESSICIGAIMADIVSNNFLMDFKKGIIKNPTDLPDEIVSKFFAGGFLAVVQGYYKNDKNITEKQLIEYIYKFINSIYGTRN